MGIGRRLGGRSAVKKRRNSMQFGMFYEIQVPKPGHENAKHVMSYF
jgi:hypothetical protein